MRPKRLFLAGLIALGLAPGIVVRAPPPVRDFTSPVKLRSLALERQQVGVLTLEAGWLLESDNDLFGGWSALVAMPDGSLFAGSDSGKIMMLERPDRTQPAPKLDMMAGRGKDKRERDLEALSLDPSTGLLWGAFEQTNTLMRIRYPRTPVTSYQPSAMADWPDNAGPESLVQFDDGRLLVIAEDEIEDGRYRGLLFRPSPRGLGEPLAFSVEGREDYRPSEAAALPDGRLLILLRTVDWGLPPRFPVLLVLADPAQITPDAILPTRELARIADPLPSDNFEGMTVTQEDDGRVAIWLISDDNKSRYQRTLLLKLTWDGQFPSDPDRTRQKARR